MYLYVHIPSFPVKKKTNYLIAHWQLQLLYYVTIIPLYKLIFYYVSIDAYAKQIQNPLHRIVNHFFRNNYTLWNLMDHGFENLHFLITVNYTFNVINNH